MSRKVAVLGCGPAGMMVAHAATLRGCTVTIFSQYKPSAIGGAQYLHQAIPECTSDTPDGVVNFIKTGTEENYAERVYGDRNAPNSWPAYESGEHKIWNMRRAYAWLWSKYESRIVDMSIDPHKVAALGKSYTAILSTIPRSALCLKPEEHRFKSQPVWITDEDLGLQDNEIVMNGMAEEEGVARWYRASKIFGFSGVEYPMELPSAVRVVKPLKTNCDCFQSIYKFGRYGRWQKGVLIHDAFNEAYEVLG